MLGITITKQLKDAGFPQEPEWHVDVNVGGGSWYYLWIPDACAGEVFCDPDTYKKGIERGDNLVKIPSLEELLHETKNKFLSIGEGMETCHIELIYSQIEKSSGWTASAREESYTPTQDERMIASGNTAEEAVAELWCKLDEIAYALGPAGKD